MTKTEFINTISMQFQADKRWELKNNQLGEYLLIQ